MTATDTITPSTTFEEWLAAMESPPGAAHTELARQMYERSIEQAVHREKITSIPTCPDWCTEGAGHDYDSSSLDDPETFVRTHCESIGTVWISQDEHNRRDTVTLDAPTVWIDEKPRGAEYDAQEARALASELVAASYRLDRITREAGR